MAKQMDSSKSIFGAPYKETEAKFSASLLWLIFQATKDGPPLEIPSEIMNPTTLSEFGDFEVKASIAEFLTNGDVYFRVSAKILRLESEPRSFWGVIQAVSKHGFYVVCADGKAVSDTDLQDSEPFNVNAHIALMESLLMAYSAMQVSVQQIVSAVRRFSSFNAAKELPFDLEDALILWMNKVNGANDIAYYGKKMTSSPSEGKQRFRFKKDGVQERAAKLFPTIEDLHSDLKDGKTLLSLLLFYCPESITVDCIKLSKLPTSEEAIHNIELFRELCAEHLTTSVFSLRTEDFFHCNPLLKSNFLALLCDIFATVELEANFAHSLVSDGGHKQMNDATLKNVVKGENQGQVVNKETQDPRIKTQHNREITTSETSFQPGDSRLPASGPSVLQKTREQKDGAVGPRNRQPLLSKRSKQQLARLEAGKMMDAETEVQDVRVDDYDFQKSTMISSGTDRANIHLNPTESFHAWKTGEQMCSHDGKPARISLDFRPDSGPLRQRSLEKDGTSSTAPSQKSIKENDHLPSKSENNINDDMTGPRLSWLNSASLREFEQLERLHATVDNTPGPLKSLTSHSSTSNSRSQEILLSCQSNAINAPICNGYGMTDTYESKNSQDFRELISRDDLNDFRSEVLRRAQHSKIMKPVQSSNEHHVDLDEPQFEDDDPYGFGASNILHFDSKPNCSSPQHPPIVPPVPHSHPPFFDDHLDDDYLSTITETSEPTSPSVYSFQSSATLSDNAGTPKINLSRETLNQDLDDDLDNSPELMHPSHIAQQGFVYSVDVGNFNVAELGYLNEARAHTLGPDKSSVIPPLKGGQPSLHTAEESCLELRGSYTVVHGFKNQDHARAAGLPVIADIETPNPHNEEPQLPARGREERSTRALPIQGHGSQEGSDFEEVPIIIRTGSRSSRSRSSSSGISVDDGRIPVESEMEDLDRPGLAVYSSLSEQTGGSPSTFDAEDTEEMSNGHLRRPSRSKRRQRPETWYGPATNQPDSVPRGRSASDSATDEFLAKNGEQDLKPNDHDNLVNASMPLPFVPDPLAGITFQSYKASPSKISRRANSIDEGTVSDDEKISIQSRLLDRRRFGKMNSAHCSGLVDALLPLSGAGALAGVEVQCTGNMSETKAVTSILLSRMNHEESQELMEKLTWLDVSKERNEISRFEDNTYDGDSSIHVERQEIGPQTSWVKAFKDRSLRSPQHIDSSSDDEVDNGDDKEDKNLGSRLASLRMQLEERRKHIEKEKKKMVEKWNEERMKSAHNAFWLMIGKDKQKEVEREARSEQKRERKFSNEGSSKGRKVWDLYVPKDEPLEADNECSPKEESAAKKKGLMFFPLHESKSTTPKSLDFKQGLHALNSPPMECSTPLSPPANIQKIQQLPGKPASDAVQREVKSSSTEIVKQSTTSHSRVTARSSLAHFELETRSEAVSDSLPERGQSLSVFRASNVPKDKMAAENGDSPQPSFPQSNSVEDNAISAYQKSTSSFVRTSSQAMDAASQQQHDRVLLPHDQDLPIEGLPEPKTRSEAYSETCLTEKTQEQEQLAINETAKFQVISGGDDHLSPTLLDRINDHVIATPTFDQTPRVHESETSDRVLSVETSHLVTEHRKMSLREQCTVATYAERSEVVTVPSSTPDDRSEPVLPVPPVQVSVKSSPVIPLETHTSDQETVLRSSSETYFVSGPSIASESNRKGAAWVVPDDMPMEVDVVSAFERQPEEPEKEKTVRRRSGGVALDIALSDGPSSSNDGTHVTPNDGLALNGMTPDQLKKRERFIQNRLRQQQEQKAKREADMEKRRRIEEKKKERKEILERKEEEGRDRLRKKRQLEEELARRKAEEEETVRKREEQMWRLRHFTSNKEEVEVRHTVDRFHPIGHTSSSHSGSTGHIHSPEEEFAAGLGSATFREYNGPPVYVKPSGKSNRKIIVNAISHCCLSGEVNKDAKEKCLQVLSTSDASHFLVLFRDGLKFRGLYSYAPENDTVTKLYGLGPRHITTKMIEKLYKYNSGGKEFTEIHAKSFSIQVDGLTIKKEYWISNKQGVSKTNTNLKKAPVKQSGKKL